MEKILNKKNYTLIILILLNIILGFKIISIFPQSKEEVTIIATGNKNIDSQGNEIWLRDIILDERNYEIPKPLNGKWICGNIDGNYLLGWRTYNKSDDTTDEIVIEIPVGINRRLEFQKNVWRGIVKIKYNNEDYIIDCYENTTDMNNSVSLMIKDSTKILLLISKIKLILISIILLLIEIVIIKKIFNKKSSFYYKNIKEELISIFMMLVMFLIMFKTSDVSLWNDEIGTIDFVYKKNNLFQAIEANVKFIDNTPPLFNIIAYFWIKLIPYGERYIYLLSEIILVLGVWILFIAAKIGFSKKVALYTILFTTISTTLMLNCGHEFRSYAILFLMSNIYIYAFFYRMKNKYSLNSLLLFSVSIVLLAYTHYYGVILCFCMFFYDTRISLKNKNYRYISSYILAGILYLPWIVALFYNNKRFSIWPPIPTFKDFFNLVFILLGNNQIFVFIFIFSFIYVFILIFIKKYKKALSQDFIYNLSFLWISIVSTVLFSYFISISGFVGSFFYSRYFIIIIPMIFLIMGFVMNFIYEEINYKLESKLLLLVFIVTFSILTNINNYNILSNTKKAYYQPFREAITFIRNQEDVYNSDTLILTSVPFKGGIEYIFTENGKYGTPNILNFEDILENKDIVKQEDLKIYKKLYIINLHTPISGNYEEQVMLKYDLINVIDEYGIKIFDRKSDILD